MNRRLFTVALAAAIGFSACGGDDKKSSNAGGSAETTTTTLAPITKAAYVEQANAICKTMNDKADAIEDPGEDLAKTQAMLQQTKQVAVDGLTQLRALRLPAGEEAAINAAFAKVDLVIADIDQALAALTAGDLEKFVALADQLDKHADEANAASTAAGLTVCGEE